MTADTASLTRIDPLTAYGMAGLRRCWMPDRGRWSHKYHLDGRSEPNESVPPSDVYYSINVLLGLAKVPEALVATDYDAKLLLRTLCTDAQSLPVRHGTWGMALWAAAELGIDPPGAVRDRLWRFADDCAPAAVWRAQDVGLSLTGACAQAAGDPGWRRVATGLRDLLLQKFKAPGALFRDGTRGPRRHFATFATQVYAALALYHYGETFGDETSLQSADDCVRRLIALQGERGEWPWFYAPATQSVLDRYEVYSVHQHGMAPALLHHAVARAVPGAKDAMLKGFGWIFGDNELGVSMLVPDLSLIHRSQARRGTAARREARLLRATWRMLARQGGAAAAGASALCLTQEMRSYEFGWLLWSFSGRTDYADCIFRPEFQRAAA